MRRGGLIQFTEPREEAPNRIERAGLLFTLCAKLVALCFRVEETEGEFSLILGETPTEL